MSPPAGSSSSLRDARLPLICGGTPRSRIGPGSGVDTTNRGDEVKGVAILTRDPILGVEAASLDPGRGVDISKCGVMEGDKLRGVCCTL